LILLASIDILFAEYRLSDSDLKRAVPAFLCAGIASALRKAAAQHHPKDKLGRKEESPWLVGFECIIGAIGIIFFWPGKTYGLLELHNMSLWLLLPLAMIVSATTTALLLGRSTIFPMDEDLPGSVPGINTEEYDMFTLLFLTGFIQCFLTMPARRSYTNQIQYFCFAIAVPCANFKLLTSARKKWNLWRVETLSHELLDGLAEEQIDSDEAIHPQDLRGSSNAYGMDRGYKQILP
jgi:hypothetical protein